jgi:ABC-2 type transport system ATP-binding protein
VTTTAISTSRLTKYYGDTPGIIDLDLEVRVGEVFGFLGPNGSGKSTTIRTLLHLLHPSSGSGEILGMDVTAQSAEIRARVGYLPGDLAMYDDMTAAQLFQYFGALRGVDVAATADQLAARLQLDVSRKIGSYSTGNRQKAAIVQAFMHRPELLVLDEPTTGLDPLMQLEFFEMIDEVRAEGRTVFLSSHILPEVERLADRVGIVRDSRLVTVQSVADLRARALHSLELVFSAVVDVNEFELLPSVRRCEPTHGGRGVLLSVAGSLSEVMDVAGRSTIENIRTREGDLEEAFLAFYQGGDADVP